MLNRPGGAAHGVCGSVPGVAVLGMDGLLGVWLDVLPSAGSASSARNTSRGDRGGVPAGDVGVPEAARGCAGDWPVVPAGNIGDDGGKGTGTELVCSSRKSKAAREGGAGSSEKGKEDSSKTTWREMITRLVCRSRQM